MIFGRFRRNVRESFCSMQRRGLADVRRQVFANSALKQLEKLDVEVKVGTKVLGVTAEGVQLENEFIRARTVVWAAGNAASPLAKQLGETDRQGRIIVNEDLSVPAHPRIFAIGDVANFSHQGGKPLPGIAPFAMQIGRHTRLGTSSTRALGKSFASVSNIGTKGAWRRSVATKQSPT